MSLGDDLAAASEAAIQQPARRDRPRRESSWDGNEGFIETEPLAERPTTWDAYIRDALGPDVNIEDIEVVEPVNVRGYDATIRNADKTNSVVRLHYYKLNLRRRSKVSQDLPAMMALAKSETKLWSPAPPLTVDRVNVILWADPQTGKVARRGGTKELIERVAVYLAKLEDYLARHPADAAVLLDLGDAIEGFENTRQQEGTNDLSLMDQVDVAGSLLWEFTALLARLRGQVMVRGVGSNHCRWRKGKDALGFPGDDWGIYLLKQLRKGLGYAGMANVDVAWPDKHEETLSFEVAGKILGLAHGHQSSKPDGIPVWWGKQVHGGQPLAHADILHTGHFHHLRIQPSGRNPWTDRSKWWIQGTTADNGSDWYRQLSGDDSDPGLVVYTLTRGEDGFPFGSLEVL